MKIDEIPISVTSISISLLEIRTQVDPKIRHIKKDHSNERNNEEEVVVLSQKVEGNMKSLFSFLEFSTEHNMMCLSFYQSFLIFQMLST